MKTICVSCKTSMQCEKMGVHVLLLSDGEPYQLWAADKYKCKECGYEVITNFGREPMAGRYQSDFTHRLESLRLRHQVLEIS